MFSIGDKVVHSPEGVCIIEDVVVMDIDKEKKEYYMLRSIVDHCVVVYIPTKTKHKSVRHLKSREEVQILLQLQPEKESFFKQNNQKRFNIQRHAILSDDSEKLMQLIKLYMQKKENDHIAIGDSLWLEHAEKYLLSEISEVLGIEYETCIRSELIVAS